MAGYMENYNLVSERMEDAKERIAEIEQADAELKAQQGALKDQIKVLGRERWQLHAELDEHKAHLRKQRRFSPTVDIEDISHCNKLSKLSFEAMVGGIDKYMQEYFDFPKFCDQVAAAFKSRGFISKRDLNREFFRRMRMGFELDRVIHQLIKQGLIQPAVHAPPTGGHTAEGWEWVG